MGPQNRCRSPQGAWLVGLALALGGTVAQAQIGSAPLADAAKAQDWAGVTERVRDGANIDQPQGDGATALHWAAYWDHLHAARALIDAGASVEATNDLGVTPLWLACHNGSHAMVDVLLGAGADPNTALPSGETPLMTASRTGNVEVVRSLLSHGADVDAREHAQGQTALMWAVAQRHPAIVHALLERGAGVADRSDAYPQVISSSGNADPRGVYGIDQGGYTPLLFAARHGSLTSARHLVAAGADANDVAPVGTSVLVVAAHGGHGELAAFLLEKGADPDAAEAGYTALHLAVLRGDLDLVKQLLAHGASPDAALVRGTPARRVSADWRLAHDLIDATPYWLAARFREPEIMRVLMEHGADPLKLKGRTTAVMAALEGGTTRGRFGVARPDPAEERRRTTDALALALEAGTEVNATNERGDTALHIAATRRLDHVIPLLVEGGAGLDARNEAGQTPLGLAQAGPQGQAALYRTGGGNSSTAMLLRELGARDEGAGGG